MRGSSQGDCFSQDSCTGSQDLGECVSNSVAEAMIMEIKDMYHPAFRVFSDFVFSIPREKGREEVVKLLSHIPGSALNI